MFRWVSMFAVGGALLGCSLAFPVHERESSNGSPPGDAGSLDESAGRRDYRAEVMADSPELYLRLGENAGPTAKDETGRYDGTYPATGVTYAAPGALAGDPNTAVTFDGLHGITMPPGLDFPGDAAFTLELWVNETAYNNYGWVLDHDDYAHGRAGWDLFLAADSVEFERWSGANDPAFALTTEPLPLGSFHHVVVTFDGTEARLYIDAQPRAAAENYISLAATGTTWSVGGQNCCGPNHFIGVLDELAVYAKTLAPDRIAAHYHAAGR